MAMAQVQVDYRALIHSPAESATAYVTYAENLARWPGLTWGVKSLDAAIVPLRPGDVIGIIARPGHGKSTLSAYLARKTAQDIVARDMVGKECVVYVTFEQSVEEIEAFFEIDQGQYSVTDLAWGKADLNVIKSNSLRRISLPIWMMGKSMMKRGRIPRMTVSNVYHALETMERDHHIKPSLIVLDYIQIVPVDAPSEKAQQVGEAINRSKELALDVGCPIVICVQASRSVDDRQSKIPTVADCQWSSAIEQVADKLIGIWRPCLTETTEITLPALNIVLRKEQITQSLLITKLLKQRMAAAGHVFALHFAPEYVQLADMELRSLDL